MPLQYSYCRQTHPLFWRNNFAASVRRATLHDIRLRALFRNDCLGVIELRMAYGLAGKRVLIIEDEHLFAEYLADAMTAEGAEVIDLAGTVKAALIANTRLDGVISILSSRAK
jgi:hypothetical protein